MPPSRRRARAATCVSPSRPGPRTATVSGPDNASPQTVSGASCCTVTEATRERQRAALDSFGEPQLVWLLKTISGMPGIVDVARKAGVSITTVSRTFNPVSDYPVAQATRQRVLAAAAALQYSPSALARALVTRRSRIVGVLLGDIVDPYFAEIVRGIEDVARRAGYLVIVCNTSRDPGTERRYVSALRDYRADAIMFLGGDIFDEASRRALERDMV